MDDLLQIKVDQVSVNYGLTQALKGISIDIPKGDFLCVIGPNGGGKSTLMKAILGLVPLAQGRLTLNPKSMAPHSNKIAYVPQFSTVNRQFPISVFEAVLQGRLKKGMMWFKHYSESDRSIAQEKIELMGLENLKNRQIDELSGGEFQRMLIARALCLEPEIICLDEPTASVDEASKYQILEALAKINQKATVILITHDLNMIESHAKHLICLNRKVIYDGVPLPTREIVSMLYGNGRPHSKLPFLGKYKDERKSERILKVIK